MDLSERRHMQENSSRIRMFEDIEEGRI